MSCKKCESNNPILDTLIETNSRRYNLEKCVEECLELAEVLMKKVLKEGGPKEPDNSAIIEELGDVQIRVWLLSKIFGESAVEDRIKYKLNKFTEYLAEEKYIGKI
jgi:NTP pyrophosphatase (non-canonical NTP hydrolase)